MTNLIYQNDNWQWWDISHPTAEELEQIALKHLIHPMIVKDCLDPGHLPKFEMLGSDECFAIFRILDHLAAEDAETIQEISRKIAVYFSPKYLITVHRADLPKLEEIKERIHSSPDSNPYDMTCRIFKASIRSYENTLINIGNDIDVYEQDIFRHVSIKNIIQNIYHTKRKASTIRRLTSMHNNIMLDMEDLYIDKDMPLLLLNDTKDTIKSLESLNEETQENINNLFNLYFSISTQKNNDNMAYLTLLSAFFLPLTFIVGLYGMNFDNIPILNWRWGYAYIWGIMIIVTVGIYLWFRKRKIL